MDGCYVNGMSELDAEEKDRRKPNERLHSVVQTGKSGEEEEELGSGGRGPGSTTVAGFCRELLYRCLRGEV